MILDFFIKLGDHEVYVQVDELSTGKFCTIVREYDFKRRAIVDIDSTFVSKRSAIIFAKRYVEEYISEL